MAIDPSGNLYFGDGYNFVIREVTTDKIIHTRATINDNTATAMAVTVDASGSVFYSTGGLQLFKLTQSGAIVAGTLTSPDNATALAMDHSGALYVTSSNTQRLLKITGGIVTAVAGAYPYDVDPLPQQATSVRLHLNLLLIGLAVDAAGDVYFPELDGNLLQRIDKLTPAGTLSAVNTPLKLPTKGAFTAQAVAITQVYRSEPGGGVRWGFWGANAELALMVILDLFPGGVIQLWDSIANGYWHARRLTFLMGGTFHKLEWLRMVGDMVFLLAGALPITLGALRSVWKRDLSPTA